MKNSNISEGIIKKTDSDILERVENNTSDIISIHDLDGRYRYVTPSVKVMLGYSPEELIGGSPYEHFHPEDIERIRRDSHARALKGMDSSQTRIEYRCRKKDRSYTWLQTQTTPILDSGGSVIELMTVSRDISDRKQVEQASHDMENSYRKLFMSSPMVKLIIDAVNGNITHVNQAAVDFYGYNLEELRTMTIFEINVASPEDITEYMSKVSKSECKSIPFQHKFKNRDIREVEVYSGPVSIRGKVLLHSSIIDVTAPQKKEEELKESRERLSLVIRGAKAGIWDWDMRSNRVFHDKRWKAILGYEEDEISGDADMWISRWHPDDVAKIRTAGQNYLSGTTEKYEVEYRLRHKDGTYRWILTNGKVTRDQDGQPIRWTDLNIDITDNKLIEELYLESEILEVVRELKVLGVGVEVIFEKENISSLNGGCELMLTVLSSFAQEETKNVSDNIKWRYKRKFEQGEVAINTTRFLGYDKDQYGELVINRGQTEIVERIFNDCANGKGANRIAKDLEADGVPNWSGKAKWHGSTIQSMLTNVKYKGDALLQKSYTVDFLAKKRIIPLQGK